MNKFFTATGFSSIAIFILYVINKAYDYLYSIRDNHVCRKIDDDND